MPDQPNIADTIQALSLDALAAAIPAQGMTVKTALRNAQQQYAKEQAPELYTLYDKFQLTFDGIKRLYDSLDSVRGGIEEHQRESFLGEFRGLDHNVRKSIEETQPSLGAINERVRRGRADMHMKTAYAEIKNFYDTLPFYLDRFNKLKEETQTVADTGFLHSAPGIKYVTKFVEGLRINNALSYILWGGAALVTEHAVRKLWRAWKSHRGQADSVALRLADSSEWRYGTAPAQNRKKRHSFVGFCTCCLVSVSPLLGARYGLPRVQDYLDRVNGEKKQQAVQLQEGMKSSYAPLLASILEEDRYLTRLEQLLHNAPEKERRKISKRTRQMRGDLQKMKETLDAAQKPEGR